jgi:uncharacterized surface protein with fasciclin (FAS1) repeats
LGNNRNKNSKYGGDLKAASSFTELAPRNDDFAALPKGKPVSLMKDPTKLATIIKAHAISGFYDKTAFSKAFTADKGIASLKTINEQTYVLYKRGDLWH